MFASEDIVEALFLALLLDILLGDPAWLYRHVPHPVVLVGRAITGLERRLRRSTATDEQLRRQGRLLTLILVLAAAAAGLVLQWLCLSLPYGWALLAVPMSMMLAQKSLADHVRAVAEGLTRGLGRGRAAVAHIVGRDPGELDAHGVARAAVESLAENFADGVAAPAFWALVLGLPGLFAYKAINTADSMIGHKTGHYLHFGRFAARLDDAVNWLPARLAGLIIVLAALTLPGASPGRAWQAIRRDARHHRSPNAGWPEAAMAGALELRIAGPRVYGGVTIEDGWMGAGRSDLEAGDVRRALGLFWRASGVLLLLVFALALF